MIKQLCMTAACTLAACSQPTAQSRWAYAAVDNGIKAYVDTATIATERAGIRTAWIKLVPSKSDKVTYALNHSRVDCNAGTSTMLYTLTHYRDGHSNGVTVPPRETDATTYVVPDSAEELVLKRVCQL